MSTPMRVPLSGLLKGTSGHLIALLSGALTPLGFAPFELWPLSLLAALGFLVSLIPINLKTAAFRGWLFGVGFFGVGASWVYVSIHQFGHAAVWLAGLLTTLFVFGIALFFAIHGLLFRWLIGRCSQPSIMAIWIGFPVAWVLSEWFRSWFLTGFPWIYLGYAPMDTWLQGWAPVTGVYGLSFWSSLTAASVLVLIQANATVLRAIAAMVALFPWLAGYGFNTKSWVEPSSQEPLKVAMIQGNIPQNLKWNPSYRQRIFDHYLKNTLKNLDQHLVIWPETAIPQLFDRVKPSLQPLEKLLTESDVGLITGIPSRTETASGNRYHNSIVGLAKAEGIYHKQRLVPFGEYVPLEQFLRGLIAFFDLPMSSFSLGPADQPPLVAPNGHNISAFVCYEIVYPDLVAHDARRADYLLTLSNDSWFGNSLAPHQHLQMARMRALENGRYLLRGTNNGISAIVNHKGEIVDQTEQFVATVLKGEVYAMQGQTPFTSWGSLPVLILCGIAAAALSILRLSNKNSQSA